MAILARFRGGVNVRACLQVCVVIGSWQNIYNELLHRLLVRSSELVSMECNLLEKSASPYRDEMPWQVVLMP